MELHLQYFQLLTNPFNIDVDEIPVELQLEIIDLQSRNNSFKTSPLIFSSKLLVSFLKIKNIAAKHLRVAISHMEKIKDTYGSRKLTGDHLHHVFRAGTRNFNVEVEKIINNTQQNSHFKHFITKHNILLLY